MGKLYRVSLFLVVLNLFGCSSMQVLHSKSSNNIRAAKINIELAVAYISQERFDLAKIKLVKARKLVSDYAPVYAVFGYYWFRVGKVKKATANYKKALTLAPNNPYVQNSYGLFLCESHQYKKSLKYFLKAAGDDDFSSTDVAYKNAALCAKYAHEYKKSAYYFKEAARFD